VSVPQPCLCLFPLYLVYVLHRIASPNLLMDSRPQLARRAWLTRTASLSATCFSRADFV
jgi:hypothetical protein